MFIKYRIGQKLTYFQVTSFQIIEYSTGEFMIRYWTSSASVDDDNFIEVRKQTFKTEFLAEKYLEVAIRENRILDLDDSFNY